MAIREELLERVLAVADEFALLSLEFLDEKGEVALGEPVTVIIGFVNGQEISMTYEEFKIIEDYEFEIGKEYSINH